MYSVLASYSKNPEIDDSICIRTFTLYQYNQLVYNF